jgi:hypothetical protein
MHIPDMPAPMIATRGDRSGVVITASWAPAMSAPLKLFSIKGGTSGTVVGEDFRSPWFALTRPGRAGSVVASP